ncbi:MAG: hypothetical protein JST48_14985 [Bacteroidetes bacterium]|nr:hypothetical protein [Bacteroidota bacterium]
MEHTEHKIFLDELIVVLVIYQMKIADSPAFQSLSKALKNKNQQASLFIYDNSPLPQAAPDSSSWKITYNHDPANPGVSKAYNEGFVEAKKQNKKWMLLADQDTVFPESFFQTITETIFEKPLTKLLVPIVRNESIIISPFCFRLGKGTAYKTITPKSYSLKKTKFINSGLVVSADIFESCDGYDERFPLDFSDLAFAERILKHHDELVVIDAICWHSLSSSEDSSQEILRRFPYYLSGSIWYGEITNSFYLLAFIRFLRALKMSVKFKTLAFVKVYLHRTNRHA